jgi:hypothetical protein
MPTYSVEYQRGLLDMPLRISRKYKSATLAAALAVALFGTVLPPKAAHATTIISETVVGTFTANQLDTYNFLGQGGGHNFGGQQVTFTWTFNTATSAQSHTATSDTYNTDSSHPFGATLTIGSNLTPSFVTGSSGNGSNGSVSESSASGGTATSPHIQVSDAGGPNDIMVFFLTNSTTPFSAGQIGTQAGFDAVINGLVGQNELVQLGCCGSQNEFLQFTVTSATPAPEPVSVAVLSTGLIGLAAARRRRTA